MSKKDYLNALIEQNNGYLLTSQVRENDISKTYMAKFVKENNLERVARGIYITEDVWPDELYIMQMRNEAVIFSDETALFLHGLMDREYTKICVTVPTGYNATHLKSDNVQVRYAPAQRYDLGICMVPSASGNMVRVYDKERTICDLIAGRANTEVQIFQTAIKEYMSSKDKKLSKLVEYAEILGIHDEVMKYVEVLV